jgi:two-component system sensor histidine kinase PilS (NtrC family)
MVSDSLSVITQRLQNREQYFFALFRCLEASLLALWVFSPFSPYFYDLNALTPLNILSVCFLMLSGLFFVIEKRNPRIAVVLLSISIDVLVFAFLAWLLPVGFFTAALMMLVNLAAAGLLLSNRQSALITLCAILVLLGQYLFNIIIQSDQADITQSLMFAVIYATTVLFCQMLAKQAQQSQALAEERGQQLLEMAQMNELIIKRMRTGVILLDSHHRIILSNEAASALNHKALTRDHMLSELAPELDKRLWLWRQNPANKPQPLTLFEHGPEVIPRFIALTKQDVMYIAFLDDSRVFSGRADELNLAKLGLLSASIAHEIRNPLAAISYAQQLMAESEQIDDSDRSLLDIIGKQSKRMNGIIENVLQIAKRETAIPESIDLNAFCENFIKEFLVTSPKESEKIALHLPSVIAIGLFDPLHLYQILNVLLNNALSYGHDTYEQSHIQIALRMETDQPIIDVIDRGPGITPEQAKNLFTPFFTTGEHGTGLGLYIAKQLAEANQGQLRYEPVLGGGSRFSIMLSGGQSLLVDGHL